MARVGVGMGRQLRQNRLTKKLAALGITGGTGQPSMRHVGATAGRERGIACVSLKQAQQRDVAIRIRLNTRKSIRLHARRSLHASGMLGGNGQA